MNYNPLNLASDIASSYSWGIEIDNREEIFIDINGQWCIYKIHFFWLEEANLLYISCFSDLTELKRLNKNLYELIHLCNQKLWSGHFEIMFNSASVVFRHSIYLKMLDEQAASHHIEESIKMIIAEYDRFYPALNGVLFSGLSPHASLNTALLDVVGEA